MKASANSDQGVTGEAGIEGQEESPWLERDARKLLITTVLEALTNGRRQALAGGEDQRAALTQRTLEKTMLRGNVLARGYEHPD
jgi:ABC-type hemin transport system ATPase subunit